MKEYKKPELDMVIIESEMATMWSSYRPEPHY